MKFEMYESHKCVTKVPRVMLNQTCLALNGGADKECGLEGYKCVDIGYNAKENCIALFPQKKNTGGSMKIQRRKNGSTCIGIIGVLTKFNLLAYRGRILKHEPPKEPGGMILLRLPKLEKREAAVKPTKKKTDYACIDCGETNVAWKYKESFKPEGHPKVCPKCHCPDFEEVVL